MLECLCPTVSFAVWIRRTSCCWSVWTVWVWATSHGRMLGALRSSLRMDIAQDLGTTGTTSRNGSKQSGFLRERCLVVCLVCITLYYCVFTHFQTLDLALSPRHSHPVPTKLPYRVTRMATRRDPEYNQMSCVLRTATWLQVMTNDWSNTAGPLLQPGSLSNAKRTTRVRRFLFLCSDVGRESSSNSTQIPESHERPSLGLSGQRVEVRVTGLFFAIPRCLYGFNLFCSPSCR